MEIVKDAKINNGGNSGNGNDNKTGQKITSFQKAKRS